MPNILHISYQEFLDWQAQGRQFQLIDVRSAEEHEAYNIGGELIPLDELMRQLPRIATHCPVLFYCRKGIRSQIAIQRLQEKLPEGQFYNLQGGIGSGS